MDIDAPPEADAVSFASDCQPMIDAARTSLLPTVLCALDRPGHPVLFANDAFARLCGCTATALIGQGWTSRDAADAPPVSLALAETARAGVPATFDALLRTAGGGAVPCRLYVSTVPGRPFLMVQAVDAGPAAASALATAETLLRDLRHRVMNHLQFIQSVLHMQSQRVDSEPTREALRDIAARIDTLAVVYRQLYATRSDSRIELAGYLGQLVSNLSAFYDREGRIALMIDAPDDDLLLPVERAFPLGLIVTELVVNSFKHAFHGRPGGTIAITIARPAADHAVVEVCDDGPGMPEGGDAAAGKRLGLTLIRSLAAQIGGTVTIGRGGPPSAPGARVALAVPLAE